MVEEFFDRHNEVNLLKSRYEKLSGSELLVLYGRRRVGKTKLLVRFLDSIESKKVYLYVNLAEKTDLMGQFSKSIRDQTGDGVEIRSWSDFFDYLAEGSKTSKFVVVIDEFQRFDSVSPEFISMLQDYLDRKFKNRKLLVILVGSSMGMTEKLVLSSRGPLYGRAAVKKKIGPFRYIDFREMFSGLSEQERIEYYSFFGGTPFYLEAVKGAKGSLTERISKLVLEEEGPLFDEPITLLSSELRSFQRYNSILSLIASGKRELKEIADAMQTPQTQLTPYLLNLAKLLDIVKEENPVFGKKKSKRYTFSDNFFRSWYRFVFPNKSAVELKNYASITRTIEEGFDTYVSRCFEDIAKELLTLLNGAKIGGTLLNFEEIGSWWDGNDEIDIVCRGKDRLLLGEVKYTKEPINGLTELNELEAKAKKIAFGGKKDYIIISKSGFSGDTRSKLEALGVVCLDLKGITELFDKITKAEAEQQKTLDIYA